MFSNKRRNAASRNDSTTIIASGVVVRGDVQFSGSLHLEGRVEGVISATDGEHALFTLSERGTVVGEVRVPRAVINGRVEGDIHCSECLELAADAMVQGDVHYKVLEMAAGAKVNGRVLHESDTPKRLTQMGEAADEGRMESTAATASAG